VTSIGYKHKNILIMKYCAGYYRSQQAVNGPTFSCHCSKWFKIPRLFSLTHSQIYVHAEFEDGLELWPNKCFHYGGLV